MNVICLLGRLTTDPELRRTQTDTAVTSFSVAVDRAFQPKDSEQRQAEEFTAFERTYVVMLACAAAFTLSALRTIKGDLAAYVRPLSDPKFLICVVVLSLFCSILCNNMVNYAAGKMSVVKLSSLGSLTTLCSMFAGVVLLHEPLTPALLLGSVLILVGIRQVTKQQ